MLVLIQDQDGCGVSDKEGNTNVTIGDNVAAIDRQHEKSAAQGSIGAATSRTVAALFDDQIDAELALNALRKSDLGPEQISLLARDREARDDRDGGHVDVARALIATALGTVGGWLQGLAALIVPERGTYLVAGPIGAALAGIRGAAVQSESEAVSIVTASGLDPEALLHTLMGFGFAKDEATYLEQRLAAGSKLIAVSLPMEGNTADTRQFFADHNAVYIGQALTDGGFAARAQTLLAAAPEASSSGGVMVADAVAYLHKVCHPDDDTVTGQGCGIEVVDRTGETMGVVEEILADGPSSAEQEIRYVVVGYGGLLGIGRRHGAIPAQVVNLTATPVQIDLDSDVFRHGPSYDADAPFSRREEVAICAYYNVQPYWERRTDESLEPTSPAPNGVN